MIRNHDGAFQAAACHFFPTKSNPETVEVLACRRAVQLAIELGARKLEVELDSKGVVAMLTDQKKNLSVAGPVLEEIKSLLRSMDEYKIRWARMTANGAAHAMAKEGVCNELCKVWFQTPPDCILHVIASEIPDAFE